MGPQEGASCACATGSSGGCSTPEAGCAARIGRDVGTGCRTGVAPAEAAPRRWTGPEVRAAERRCGLPPRLWLVNDPAARRWWEGLRHVPEERRAQLALKMQRGVELVVKESVGRAREHAARQVQWAYRRLQLLQCLGQRRAGLGHLEELREARKAERKAVRARARAGNIPPSRCEARQGGEEGGGDAGQVGGSAGRGAVHPWAVGALLAAVAAWGSVTELGLARPAPSGVHYLPRPPGARFNGCRAPSGADMQLRWLWVQAGLAAESAVAQVAAQSDRGRGGRSDGSDLRGLLGGVTVVRLGTRRASQPAALCEAFRLAEGPWALPRPPEWEQSLGGDGQGQGLQTEFRAGRRIRRSATKR